MNISNHFDVLAKAAAGGLTRRAAVIWAAQAFGGLLLGAIGLRQTRAQETDAPAKLPTLVETLKDGTFKCVSRKGSTLVQGDYGVCLNLVDCVSTRGESTRSYTAMCKAKDGKCPRFERDDTGTGTLLVV